MPKKPQQLAKLSRPRLYDALPRERLFRQLDEKRAHPAIWVAGPPGSGKTTLIASFLESRQLPGIWYHVDPGDSDVSTFFYYLTEAAKTFPSRKPLPLLTSEYLPNIPGFARRFFRELYRRLPDDAAVVLDNFQEVGEDAIQTVIALAIAETPASVHLIVISRTEPGPVYSQLLANKNLVQLGWNELRLNAEEAGAIVQSRIDLDAQAFRHIFAKSGGWVAGLTLMLERLRRGDFSDSDVESVSREAVFNYFAAQIFDGANPETRAALLRTSVFSSFSLRAAECISGNPRIGKVLDDLCQRQLFTYRHGTDSVRYQYHDLFREFLVGRLEREMVTDQRQVLMREGAAALLRENMAEEALPLLLKGEDWDAATDLTGKLAPSLLAQGRFRTLSDWIAAQGDDRVQRNASLLYWLGNACMQSEIGKAAALLRQALEQFNYEDNVVGKCLCAAELIRAQYYQYDDFAPLDEWIFLLDSLIAIPPEFPDAASEMKVCSALVLALGARQPGHPRLQAVLSRTSELLNADIEVNQKVAAGMALFSYFTISNQLPKAQDIIDRLAPLSASSEVTALNQAYWWLQLGYHHFRQSEIAEAEEAWERADKFIEEHGLKQPDFVGRCFRAFHYAALYDYGRGQAVLAGLEKNLSETHPSTGALYHLARCLLEMSRENGAEAAFHGRLALANALRVGRPFYSVAWSAHTAAALAMAGDFEEADRLVEAGWSASQGAPLEGYRCSLLMSRAYSALRQGHTQQAHDSIRELVRVGREHGSWTYLRTDPTVKDVVLEEALAAGIEIPFVQMVVRQFGMRPRRGDVPSWPWPVKVYTLGEFRVEVNGEPLVFTRKAPKKPIALLKAIIAFGGKNVPERRLVDALWPEDGGDAAHEAFAVSLHRLRKLLVHADVIQLFDGMASLDVGKCWVDVWALERQMADADSKSGRTDAPGADPVWQLYRGHFLAEDADASWAVSMRERLRSQFLMHLSRSGKCHEREGRLDVATLLYQKGIDSDDLAEELYQGLMRCHMQQDRRAEAMAVYRRLRQTLSVTLGIQPSPQSEQLFRSIKGE